MRSASVKTVVAAGLLVAMGSAQADMGIGARVSTLGAGVELGKSFTDFFSLRLGLNKYSTSDSDTIDGINYNTDVDFQSTSLMLDWNPFGGSFHLTAGYLNSGNEIGVNASPAAGTVVDIGSYPSYTIQNDGDLVLDGKVKLGSGPYLGLGWGNVPAKGFGFTFEVGVVQMGKPDVSLAVTGDPTLVSVLYDDNGTNHVAEEEANMQADMDEFDTYPVVALGISFGF